jgi:ubiquinone/menaquinone biosynthesis C-methylase UbiE
LNNKCNIDFDKNSNKSKNNSTYYNVISSSYDVLHGDEQKEKMKLINCLILEDSDFNLDTNTIILDIGCGTGLSTIVSDSYHAGLDSAIKTLLIAQYKRMQEHISLKTYMEKIDNNTTRSNLDPTMINNKVKSSKHLGYILGIAENLPFKDKCCDISISVTAVHNFDDIDLALTELERITKFRIVITILKRIKNFKKILNKVQNKFHLLSSKDNDFDLILYLKPF